MEKYKITYANKMVQYKKLIDKNTFINIVKPLENEIEELETEIEKTKKNKEKQILLKQRLKELKTKYKLYTPYFIEGSPMYLSINTGLLELPQHQGGIHNIIIEKI